MQPNQRISPFLFLFVWTIARCYPTKPLNERSTELTWEAWLVIDESNNKQQDSTLKRRITPKSIFIAPSFSPENLPECSEGYQSDPMGRCTKIILLNRDQHMDFILAKLNNNFGDYDYQEETTSGPLNINIPINAVQEETDVAIVIAPTKNIGQTALEMEKKLNKTLSGEKVNLEDIAGILGLKQAEDVETTTITGTDPTTQEQTTENTTFNTQGTPSELNALFFLDSKRQVEIKTDTTTTMPTSTSSTSTGVFEDTTTEKKGDQDSELSLYQMDQALPYPDSSVSFMDIKREAVKPEDKFVLSQKTTEGTPTAFTVRSTLIGPKKQIGINQFESPLPKMSTPAPFVLPSRQESTTASMVFTPVDNLLSMEDSTSASRTTGTVAPTRIQEFYSQTPKTSLILQDTKKVTENGGIVFPEGSTTFENTRNSMVRFPSTSQYVKFPTSPLPSTSFQSTVAAFSTDISDRSGSQSTSTSFPKDLKDTLKRASSLSGKEQQLNLSTIYDRLKAHRENHRNREKHSEWFHLPTKWSDTANKPLVLRFSKKNGHMEAQEFGSVNFLRQIDARAFGFRPAIQR